MARKKIKKKSSIDDLFFIIVALMGVVLFLMIGFKITNEFKTQIDSKGLADSNGQAAVTEINNLYPNAVDNGILFLLVGLLIMTLILASLVVIHPVFLVFYIIMILFVIIFGGVASNVYMKMAENPEFINLADQLIWTSHIMQYLPIIIGVFGFILAIIMYKAWQNRQ